MALILACHIPCWGGGVAARLAPSRATRLNILGLGGDGRLVKPSPLPRPQLWIILCLRLSLVCVLSFELYNGKAAKGFATSIFSFGACAQKEFQAHKRCYYRSILNTNTARSTLGRMPKAPVLSVM